jgi:hypothetical protein
MGSAPLGKVHSLKNVAASLLSLLEGPDRDFFEAAVFQSTRALVELMREAREQRFDESESDSCRSPDDRGNESCGPTSGV